MGPDPGETWQEWPLHWGQQMYHAELGLQLDLQALERPPELCDLCLAGLNHGGVGRHLLVQLCTLKFKREEGDAEAQVEG